MKVNPLTGARPMRADDKPRSKVSHHPFLYLNLSKLCHKYLKSEMYKIS
jgi:hypothetical protein